MATSRLKIYNEALLMCGERSLAALTDNVEPRHLLDAVYDNDGFKACLESAQWKFAMRAIQSDYDTSVTTEFGYSRAHSKPTDWCLTSAVCSDPYFSSTIFEIREETGYWFCDFDTIYVRYVSNDTGFGLDLSLWPANFARFVAADFASRIVHKLTSDENKQNKVLGLRGYWLGQAKSTDAMADPPKFLPTGSWNRARMGNYNRRDRGNRGSFTG